jgi:hypothetical protein
VRWSLMLNVTQHQMGGTFSPWLWQVLLNCLHFVVVWSWRLQFCPTVSCYLPSYMGHICGLQCYHHLVRIFAVLTVQEKAVDNFPAEQDSWKATFPQLVRKFRVVMENEHSFLKWNMPATDGHCDTVHFSLMPDCQPSMPYVPNLLLQKQQIFILFKIILVTLQFLFFAVSEDYCSLYTYAWKKVTERHKL